MDFEDNLIDLFFHLKLFIKKDSGSLMEFFLMRTSHSQEGYERSFIF